MGLEAVNLFLIRKGRLRWLGKAWICWT